MTHTGFGVVFLISWSIETEQKLIPVIEYGNIKKYVGIKIKICVTCIIILTEA